jgi:hypothetical protein
MYFAPLISRDSSYEPQILIVVRSVTFALQILDLCCRLLPAALALKQPMDARNFSSGNALY